MTFSVEVLLNNLRGLIMAKRQSRREMAEAETDGADGQYNLMIQNFGPIELAKFPFCPGRITAAYGSNGAGKSEAQVAFNAIAGLGTDGVVVRDGCDSGRISGFGCEVKFTLKRCTRTGEIGVYVVEESFSLARFVRPGFKDPAANDRQRLKDLASVLGIEIPQEKVWQLVAGFDEERAQFEIDAKGNLPVAELDRRLADIRTKERKVYNAIVSEKTTKAKDPAEYVACLKADCDRVALENEKTALVLNSEADALRETLPQVPEGFVFDAEVLSSRLADAVQAKRELERRKETADDAERLAKEAERILTAGQGQTIEQAQEILTAAEAEVTESETMIADMEAALGRERTRLSGLKRRVEDAKTAKTAAEERKQEIDGARAALQQKVNRPSDSEWQTAEAEIQAAEQAVALGSKIREADKTREQISGKIKEAEEITREAEALRAAAKGVVGLLVEPINALHCGIEIDDTNRLIFTEHPIRGRCLVEELSPGEAWALVIRLLVKVVGGNDIPAIVAIPQEALEGLDPINLKMFIDEVAKTKLMPFVAKATATETETGELVRDGVFAKLVEHWKDLYFGKAQPA